jgi:hypothetical protein
MTDGPYLLGIDFGTGGARVGIFDPEGAPLVFSEREYTLEHPRPGWAEQRGTATIITGPRSSARRRGSWVGSWNFWAASVRRHKGWLGLGTCSSPAWEDVT